MVENHTKCPNRPAQSFSFYLYQIYAHNQLLIDPPTMKGCVTVGIGPPDVRSYI